MRCHRLGLPPPLPGKGAFLPCTITKVMHAGCLGQAGWGTDFGCLQLDDASVKRHTYVVTFPNLGDPQSRKKVCFSFTTTNHKIWQTELCQKKVHILKNSSFLVGSQMDVLSIFQQIFPIGGLLYFIFDTISCGQCL